MEANQGGVRVLRLLAVGPAHAGCLSFKFPQCPPRRSLVIISASLLLITIKQFLLLPPLGFIQNALGQGTKTPQCTECNLLTVYGALSTCRLV